MEDLRGRLAKSEGAAESAAEDYEKQIKALQMRLEESLEEQSKQEEVLHRADDQIEALEIQVKELTRSKRDQENIYEAEVRGKPRKVHPCRVRGFMLMVYRGLRRNKRRKNCWIVKPNSPPSFNV